MDIGLNWNEWHQETERKSYVRVGVTLLSGALILMSTQEIVSLYSRKNLILDMAVCATTEEINVSGNYLPEKITITKQIKEPEKIEECSLSAAEVIPAEAIQTDVILVETCSGRNFSGRTYGRRNCSGRTCGRRDCGRRTG